MASIRSSLADLPAPRTGNAQRHRLLDVLTTALTATICGAESCVDFADFARDREALFRDFLEPPGGLPSHDTFSRLFRLPEARLPGLGMTGMVEATTTRDGRASTLRRFHRGRSQWAPCGSPPPCAPIGGSRTACTGCWMSASTRTAPETDATMERKISPRSASSPSTSCAPPDPAPPSEASANAPAGPTNSPDPSSAECDSPGRTGQTTWRRSTGMTTLPCRGTDPGMKGERP